MPPNRLPRKVFSMKWQHFKHVPSWVLPHACRDWVLNNGSLTKRLIEVSQGDFSVNVTFQGLAYPLLDELKALNIPSRQYALIREVELLCFGEVWVRARSIIPASTMCGAERQLKILGNRPLGAFLFKSRSMQRDDLEISSCISDDKQILYGRRSRFFLHQKPLLVSEVFMPALFKFLNQSDNSGSR